MGRVRRDWMKEYLYKYLDRNLKGGPRWRIERYDGTHTTYARWIVEKVLGKRLPRKVQVHHVDGDTLYDWPGNLVVCENRAYHALLHQRADALRATGNVHSRRCNYCGKWGIPGEDMILYSPDRRSLSNSPRAKCKSCKKEEI